MRSIRSRAAIRVVAFVAASAVGVAARAQGPRTCIDDAECGPGSVCEADRCEAAPPCAEGRSCAAMQILLAASYEHGFLVGGYLDGAHTFAGGVDLGVSLAWTGEVPRTAGWTDGPAVELGVQVLGAHYFVPSIGFDPPGPRRDPSGSTFVSAVRFEDDGAVLFLRPMLRLGWEADRLDVPGEGAPVRHGLGIRVQYGVGLEQRFARYLDGTSIAHGPVVSLLLPAYDPRSGGWVRPFVRASLTHVPSTFVSNCDQDWCDDAGLGDSDALHVGLGGGVAFP